jgi:hypothetical protein
VFICSILLLLLGGTLNVNIVLNAHTLTKMFGFHPSNSALLSTEWTNCFQKVFILLGIWCATCLLLETKFFIFIINVGILQTFKAESLCHQSKYGPSIAILSTCKMFNHKSFSSFYRSSVKLLVWADFQIELI